MKLIHPDWEKQIVIDNEKVPLISIENPQYLYDTLEELNEESQTNIGRYVLSENNKILDMKKQFVFVTNPWSMDLNDRKLSTKLIANVLNETQNETNHQKTTQICGLIQSWLEEITMGMPLPITYDFNIDLEALLKAFHIHIDGTGKDLGEKMLIFMKSWNILCGEKCFAFYGFRNLIPIHKRALFYENAKVENLKFLMFEGPCNEIGDYEDWFTIDKDLCQIY